MYNTIDYFIQEKYNIHFLESYKMYPCNVAMHISL